MAGLLTSLESLTVRLLRVPPRPEFPAGSEDFAKVFRAARGFLIYRMFQTAINQVSFLIAILFFIGIPLGMARGLGEERETVAFLLSILPYLIFAFYFVQLPFSFLRAWLDYRMRWYIITSRSLRIREGIVTVHEKTLTYANIQNMSIQQGPVQRWLGISDLQVRTAGGGGGGPEAEGGDVTGAMHTGYFRGVDNAEEIRNIIASQLRKRKAPGLGEAEPAPEEPTPGESTPQPDLAARLSAAADRLLAATGHQTGESPRPQP